MATATYSYSRQLSADLAQVEQEQRELDAREKAYFRNRMSPEEAECCWIAEGSTETFVEYMNPATK